MEGAARASASARARAWATQTATSEFMTAGISVEVIYSTERNEG